MGLMKITLVDPTGIAVEAERSARSELMDLHGKRVGFVFNQHAVGIPFWQTLEAETQKRYATAGAERIYKSNTWASAGADEIARLVEETDYVLVGLGA